MPPGTLNTFFSHLADVCRRYRWEEKWLIAPSRRVARQWVEVIARAGVPVFNVRLGNTPRRDNDAAWDDVAAAELGPLLEDRHDTLVNLALYAARERLAREGLGFAAGDAAETLARAAWEDTPPSDVEYLSPLAGDPGLYRSLARTLRDLRLAGLSSSELRPGVCETEAKGRALQALLASYERALRRFRLADYADVLAFGREALLQTKGRLRGAVVIFPQDLEPTRLEADFLEALPSDLKIVLPVDEPPHDGPAAPAATTDFFRAVGEANEVKEVLRRILVSGVPLDDVEVIYADEEPYLNLIYETLLRLRAPAAGEADTAAPAAQDDFGLPVTFSDGIPATYSRPGRALALWVEWALSGWAPRLLETMLREGLVRLTPGETAPWSVFDLARAADFLRAARVGGGRDRYLTCLETSLSSMPRARAVAGEEEETPSPAPASPKLRAATALVKFARWLLSEDVTPDPAAPGDLLLGAALNFLELGVERRGPLDTYARRALSEAIRANLGWFKRGVSLSSEETWQWLRELPATTRVLGSGPRPGALYVSNARTGGHSGRGHYFLLGMDDARFPVAAPPDPLLLDDERERLSSRLTTSLQNQSRKERAARLLMARLRGAVTLSYSCYDIKKSRDGFPSPLFVHALRAATGKSDADLDTLLRSDPLATPASFAPAAAELSLDANEWWLWRILSREPHGDHRAEVVTFFEHLQRAWSGQQERESQEFTPYDGWVPQAGEDFSPFPPKSQPLSPTQLEAVARCPRAYFFQYVLKIEPPAAEGDRSAWLDVATYGKVLHDAFRLFVRELGRRGERPSARHREELLAIVDGLIEREKQNTPPPGQAAYDEDVARLRRAATAFLNIEETRGADYSQAYCEVAFGMKPSPEGTALDTEALIPIALPDGRVVSGRGQLDRVDVLPDGSYRITDYKTGRLNNYRKTDSFERGRNLQGTFYAALLEAALKARGVAAPEVRTFEYLVVEDKGRISTVPLDANVLTSRREEIALLADVIRSGGFCPTDQNNRCNYCDFRRACGAYGGSDLARIADHPALTAFKKLMGYDVGDK